MIHQSQVTLTLVADTQAELDALETQLANADPAALVSYSVNTANLTVTAVIAAAEWAVT